MFAPPASTRKLPASSRCVPATAAPARPPAIGNRAMLRRPAVQAKLTFGPVDDPLEREAARVADQVTRTSAGPVVISRKCAACEAGEEFDRTADGRQAPEGDIADIFGTLLRPPGQALNPATRARFQPRFGHEFSRVRVHTDGEAARSAAALRARAYPAGSNIVFGRGQFSPDTIEGKKLLALKLAPVVQQSPGPAGRQIARPPLPPDPNKDVTTVDETGKIQPGQLNSEGVGHVPVHGLQRDGEAGPWR